MKSIAFINNKGGVGKTSLVYHLAWMLSNHGIKVLVADLDPQSNLTSMFLDEDELADLWENGSDGTIYGALLPILNRTGDIAPLKARKITEGLGLVPGHLSLSRIEDLLSENWSKCLDGQVAAFRVITAFYRTVESAGERMGADLILIDVGPNLGAINRSALISARQVAIPLGPDLFSLQGMKNLGPTLRTWRKEWSKRLAELPTDSGLSVPTGEMMPVGYIVMQHGVRDSRPVKAYQRWLDRIPGVYRDAVLDEPGTPPQSPTSDPYSLALLKHYRSLMPLAMDAHKPMFFLKPADGAIGAHVEAVRSCYDDFHGLAKQIAGKAGLVMK